jgi:hypothetical protein
MSTTPETPEPCECVKCCNGEHPGECNKCGGYAEDEAGVPCEHCGATGICPVCKGANLPPQTDDDE